MGINFIASLIDSNRQIRIHINFKAEKRVVPSVVLFTVNGLAEHIQTHSQGSATLRMVNFASTTGENSAHFHSISTFGTASSLTSVSFHFTADAEL